MKKTLSTKLPIIFLVFLTACIPAAPSTPIGTNVFEPSVTVVSSPQPTATVVTQTPSPTPLPQAKTQCADTAQESQSLDLPGVLVLEKENHPLDYHPGFYLMNADSHYIFFTDNLGVAKNISPDGKHIAYSTTIAQKEYIRIMDNNGKLLAEFHAYYDGLIESYFNWQNEKQLRIVTHNLDQAYPWVVDPFTQERTLLKTDWEGAYRPANNGCDIPLLPQPA